MEKRPYFVFGDLLAVTTGGVLAALAVTALISTGWNMWLAMFFGMALGMLIGLPLSLGFGAFFGAMEIMVPTMLSGMLAGMWVGMGAAMAPLSYSAAARGGVAIGLFSFVVTYALDAWFKAKAARS